MISVPQRYFDLDLGVNKIIKEI